MSELVIGGSYIHYKDKKYIVTGTARHSETLEEMVIYEAQYPNDLGKVWVRPAKIFLETIKTETYEGPRFRFTEHSR